MLEREGLTRHRKQRRKVAPYTQPLQAATEPNRIWCADFKGWFRTRDGERIDPLTITDAHSRYLIRCQAVEMTDTARVQAIFEAAFRECGMPWAMRTDNGPPFASRAIAGLSRLAVWCMKLGIVPERIAAGHPEQNGRHERMHRTLKAETASPAAANRRAQQRAFDRFRREYNQERPHEALGMQTPAAVYVPSAREYPARVPEPEYGSALWVRRVDCTGTSWKTRMCFSVRCWRVSGWVCCPWTNAMTESTLPRFHWRDLIASACGWNAYRRSREPEERERPAGMGKSLPQIFPFPPGKLRQRE